MVADPVTSVVMLPGLDGTGLVFGPFRDCLGDLVSAEPVSYPIDRPMTFEEHVDFARRQLPFDRPFVLLAESFSGPIGLQLLVDPPANLLGAIFVASFVRYPRPFLVDAARHLPQALLLKLFATSPVSRFFCLGGAPAEAVRLFRRALRSVPLQVLSGRLQIIATLPPPPACAFSRPALYLQPRHDRLVPPRAVEAIQECLPQLRVETMAGPHMILLAKPEVGARLVNAFISGLRNPGQ